jgi:hypothetical protein
MGTARLPRLLVGFDPSQRFTAIAGNRDIVTVQAEQISRSHSTIFQVLDEENAQLSCHAKDSKVSHVQKTMAEKRMAESV